MSAAGETTGTEDSGSSSTDTRSGNSHGSTTSLTQSIEKLDGSMATGQSNYNAWRFRIVRILKEKDLLAAIEDGPVSSKKDDQAFTIITLNIKDSQIPYIQDARTTKDAWKALKEVHQGIGMNGRIVLLQRLWALKMLEGEDMAQHLNQFRELANQLKSISADGQGIDDSELVTILTLSLPESYEPLVMALQSRSDIVTFDMMAGRLLQESGRRHIGQVAQSTQGSKASQTAFTAQRGTYIPKNGQGRGGHSARARGGFRGRFSQPSREGTGSTEPQRNAAGSAASTSSQSTKCYYCGKTGHWKKDCFKRKADEASGQAKSKEFTFLADGPASLPSIGWIIDSGASQHISHNQAEFKTYMTVRKEESITIADGTKLQASGIGDVEISTKAGIITLTDVWHVPGIGTSLVSVARMVDAGYKVEFERTLCFVSKMGVTTELGQRHGSLYRLCTKPVPLIHSGYLQHRANLGLATNQVSCATLETWHRRLGHRTLDDAAVHYISSKVSDMNVSKQEGETHKICGICALGRQHKEAQTKTREKASELLSVIHTDICGPMQTPGIHGERYFITFTDEKSGRVSICLLHKKDEALTAFETYRARAEKTSGKEIKSLRSDGGGEYLSGRFKKYLAEAGIKHIISPPYSPAQNGLAERMNRTIMDSARCLLEDSKLGKEFWGYAVLTAAHIHNRLPSRSHQDISPLEHWTGKKPDIGHLRIFGSHAWVHIPEERRQKLDPKSRHAILVGYEEDAGSRVYRLYDSQNKKLILSRDVIIDEAKARSPGELQDTTVRWNQEEQSLPVSIIPDYPCEYQHLDPVAVESSSHDTPPSPDTRSSITLRPPVTESANSIPVIVQEENTRAAVVEQQPGVRRSQRTRKPRELFGSEVHFALVANTAEAEPQTLTEALNSTEKERWNEAWKSEVNSLAQNNTWVLEPLPEGRTAIGCRWVFKKKDDGRYKARLVAKGYSQKAGIDYHETYAPVAKFTTIRLLLVLSCESDWEVQGMDVKTAFLNSELEETVYMEIPEGVNLTTESSGQDSQRPIACRLLKSIYGLKQSPRAWYGRIQEFFLSNNFVRSEADHSLFINYEKPVILLLYVDDLVLTAPTKELVNWIRHKLCAEFSMTDLGELRNFLGLEIERNRDRRTLFLSQRKYIQKILEHHGMLDCNPSATPADPHVRLEKSSVNFQATDAECRKYQSAVGSLMYAMLGTRPDIAYAVSKVSQYSTNPDKTHWTAVNRVFRYLAGTMNTGLYYGGQGNGKGFTDADWGSADDRRSIGGYSFILNGGAICWNSKKQATVALSSTEAEYMALTQAVKESLWLQGVLYDLGAKKHLTEVESIHIDNQGAIALARNPEFHARTKHIDIQYHFVREHVENQEIRLTYCPTSENTADIFTKALPRSAFVRHTIGLGLFDRSIVIQRVASNDNHESGDGKLGVSTGEGEYCESPALTTIEGGRRISKSCAYDIQ